jgi:hypothetical protein
MTAKVEHHVRALDAYNALLVARMIELGAPARDAMVSRLNNLSIPSEHEAGGKYVYGSSFFQLRSYWRPQMTAGSRRVGS